MIPFSSSSSSPSPAPSPARWPPPGNGTPRGSVSPSRGTAAFRGNFTAGSITRAPPAELTLVTKDDSSPVVRPNSAERGRGGRGGGSREGISHRASMTVVELQKQAGKPDFMNLFGEAPSPPTDPTPAPRRGGSIANRRRQERVADAKLYDSTALQFLLDQEARALGETLPASPPSPRHPVT